MTTCLPPCPVQLRIVSSPAHLPMVRSAVDKLCQMIGFDPATAAGIVLSVDEALTNVIRHAYGMCDHLPIELTLEPLEEPAGLRIQLRDIGQAVDPARLAPHASDADELTPGGLGLLIIRNTMDHVAYEPQPGGGATLTMTKHLKTHEDHSMSYATYNSTVRAVRREGSAAIVEVVGDIDLNRSQEFQSALLTALEPLPGRVVVDLSGVPYMDSSGVASLVKLLGRCRRASVPLALVGLNVRVASVFQVTRLDTVFEILPTVTEAVA